MDKIDFFSNVSQQRRIGVFGGDSDSQEKYDTAQSGCLTVKLAHCSTCKYADWVMWCESL